MAPQIRWYYNDRHPPHPAKQFIPGPSRRLLESRGRKLNALAKEHQLPRLGFQDSQQATTLSLQTRNIMLAHLLCKRGVIFDPELADPVAEPRQFRDLPTEVLWKIARHVILQWPDRRADWRIMNYRYMPGRWLEYTFAFPELRRALLDQISQVATVEVDTRVTLVDHYLDDQTADDTWLLDGLVVHHRAPSVRHLDWTFSLGDFVDSTWRPFDWTKHRELFDHAMEQLSWLTYVFPRLRTLEISLDIGGHGTNGETGFKLRNRQERLLWVEGHIEETIEAIRDLGLRHVKLQIKYDFETERDEADFRGLSAEKAAHWICRSGYEDRIFVL